MRLPIRADLQPLLVRPAGPCVSIYLPTDRNYPSEQQGPIRYKNAVRAAEEALGQKYPRAESRALSKSTAALMDDQYFWTHRLDGLAIFGARDLFEIFDLQTKPEEMTIVADSFHVKPLLRYTQSADRFQVLCLQREKCWMLEGDRYAPRPDRPAGRARDDPRGARGRDRRRVGGRGGPRPRHRRYPPRRASRRCRMATPPRARTATATPTGSSRPSTGRLGTAFAAVGSAARPGGAAAAPFDFSASTPRTSILLPTGSSATRRRTIATKWFARRGRRSSRSTCVGSTDSPEDFGTAQARRMGSDDVTVVAAAAADGRVGVLLVRRGQAGAGHTRPGDGPLAARRVRATGR